MNVPPGAGRSLTLAVRGRKPEPFRQKSCRLYSTGIILPDGFQPPARAGCRTIEPLPSERTFLSRDSPEVSSIHPMKTSVHISRGVESLFGTRDENIRLIESGLGVHTQLVDNHLEIEGEAASVSRAESILEDYNALLREGCVFNNGDLNSYLRVVRPARLELREQKGLHPACREPGPPAALSHGQCELEH